MRKKCNFIISALNLVSMSISGRTKTKQNKKQINNNNKKNPTSFHLRNIGITETSTLKFTFFFWLHIRVYLDPIIFTTLSWKIWESQPMQLNAKSM